jgi:hypothetical protein
MFKPSGGSEGFLCEKDYFYYLTFFEDLDGFTSINKQGKIVCFVSFL